MQTYKIIGHSAILGVGLTLKLTKAQAATRTQLLKQKKKDIYIVLEPVQFKQGEIVTVVDGNVSKSVLANLEDTSKKPKKQEPQKTTKAPAKKDKKPVSTPPTTPEDDGEDDPVNPDGKNPDGDEDLQPETDDETIVNNGDVNNLPAVIK
jgi:predicted DNA-binding antitoxin AbrB/MazE fold protein